jgi:hypothetical protein
MNIRLQNAVLFILLTFLPTLAFSQTTTPKLQLGILDEFAAYTGTGAVTNGGSITGDVGTHNGVISGSGFDSTYTGTKFNNNAVTDSSKVDLLRVYIHLSDIFVTHPGSHAPAFGGGDTISPGVYSIGGAGSVAGDLTLDGGGDVDAVFILKFDGAFSIGVNSSISLSNGTRACNVYWIAEGAISVGENSVVKGTLFAHPGAVTIGLNCEIEGRMFSTEGAITLGDSSAAMIPLGRSTIPIGFSSDRAPAAAVNVLRSIENYTMFSSLGAVSNAATSGFIGDVGANSGVMSGYSTSTQVGYERSAGSITAQAKLDLDSAYNELVAIRITDSLHTAAFGSGETVRSGVYYIAGAGSLAGTITLDAQNDSDAIFVFRFNGAFSVAAQSKVIFANGTRLCNVFWIAEGALSIGTFTYMKGTAIAHDFACSMAANGNLEGRILSTSGAVSFSTGVIYIDPLFFATSTPLPITLLSFSAEAKKEHVELNWATTAEINNDYFDVEHSVDGINFTSISRIKGAGNSTQTLNYSAIHHTLSKGLSYYRLKQTDFDGKTSYSKKVAVDFNNTKDVTLDIYPNPFSGEATFQTSEILKDASVIVYNSHGAVKEIENISGQTFTFERENLRSGLYWIKLVQGDKVLAIKKLVITN